MKKIFAALAVSVLIVSLTGCSSAQSESSSEPESSSSVSASESESSSSVSESSASSEPESSAEESEPSDSQPVDDYNTEGTHTVDLCNGLGQDVVSLKIRSGSGEEDYWSYELLNGSNWADGTAISLTLQKDEWGEVSTGWEAEITLADGTVENFTDLPLTECGRMEFNAEGYRVDPES